MLKQKSFQGEKLESAYLLLTEDSTTLEKVDKIKTLLKGVDPNLDKVLEKFAKAGLALGKLERGEVFFLSAEALPEKTKEQKKRKKLLLLFFANWRSLKSEVARVKEIYSEKSGNSNQDTRVEALSKAGKILGLAKGPLGLVTITAVAIVGLLTYLKVSSVSVNVKNEGCSPLESKVQIPFSLPGLVLPKGSIASGETAVASLPPLKFNVEGSTNESLTLSVLRYKLSFNIGNVSRITLDGKNLLGTEGEVDLGNSKTHSLVIKCK